MGKHTKKQLAERVGLLLVRVNLYRLVILLLAVIIAGLITIPVLADYIQAGGQAPKIGNVEIYNEAAEQPVLEPQPGVPEGDIEAGGKLYYVPQNFLKGIEIKGDEYIDEDGLIARSPVEGALSFDATTTNPYQHLFYWSNDLSDSEDVLVTNFWIDFTDAITSYGGLLDCGTTTAPTTTAMTGLSSATILSDYYIDSTLDSDTKPNGLVNLDTTTTTDRFGSFFGTIGDYRQPTSTAFFIKSGEAFMCTLTPDASASSTDFTSTGGFAGAGRYHLEIEHRNN